MESRKRKKTGCQMVSKETRSVAQTPERKIQPRIVFGFARSAARTARNVMVPYSFLFSGLETELWLIRMCRMDSSEGVP